METFCFSSIPILRCESLSRIESEIIIIPPALGVIFSTTLLVARWGSGRRHLLLVVEGWLYFALTLLDFLSHFIPGARNSLTTFRVLDITLATLSFLPLFLYTLFLFLFTLSELIPMLPRRFQKISSYFLFVFIPVIVGLNELASFVGISYRMIPGPSYPVLAIGFSNSSEETLWTFFNSLTLALVAVYQVLHFFLTFYRLVKAFVDQRRIENSGTDENRLFKGIGWVALGVKLGAIETVVGFAQGSYGIAFTRRILRFLGRACLIIGVVKGMDTLEDFQRFRDETSTQSPRNRSNLRPKISNPRNSTFRKLSPTATAFHSTVRSNQPLPMTQGPSSSSHARERVTIHYLQGEAPSLEMRFSALDMPSPTDLVESIKSRPQTWLPESDSSRATSIPAMPLPAFTQEMFQAKESSLATTRPGSQWTYHPPCIVVDPQNTTARTSMASMAGGFQTDTVFAARMPTSRSHALARLASTAHKRAELGEIKDRNLLLDTAREGARSTLSSISLIMSNRQPASNFPSLADRKRPRLSLIDGAATGPAKGPLAGREPLSAFSSPSSTERSGLYRFSRSASVDTPDTDDHFQYDHSHAIFHPEKSEQSPSDSVHSGEWMASHPRPSEELRRQINSIEAYRQGHPGSAPSEFMSNLSDRDEFRDSNNTLEIPWLDTSELTPSDREEAQVERAWRMQPAMKPGLTRIKSIGTVVSRSTPTPRHVGFSRESITPERHEMGFDRIERRIERDSNGSAKVRADSEVLGQDDIGYVERSLVGR